MEEDKHNDEPTEMPAEEEGSKMEEPPAEQPTKEEAKTVCDAVAPGQVCPRCGWSSSDPKRNYEPHPLV